MSGSIRQYVVTLGCVLALAPAVAKPPELSHNPFTRPPSERTTPLPDRRSESPDSAQLLDLRATLVGTRDRQGKQKTIYVKPDPVDSDE